MNVTLDKVDNVNGILTISLVKEDYQADYKKDLNEAGRRHPLKGFRPGHVPAKLLEKTYGPEILSRVVDRKVSRELSKYIVDNKLNLLGEPVLDKDTKVDLVNEEEYTFKFHLGFEPEFDVKLDNELTIPYYTILVDDKMVENQDNQYRQRFGSQVAGEEITADAMVRGSIVELDEEGNVKEGGISNERAVLSPKHFKNDDQKALFVGKKIGDEVVYNPAKAADGSAVEISSLLNIDRKDAENVTADFKFKVDDILVLKPAEHDKDFYDSVLGKDIAADEDDYYAKLREMIAGQLAADSNYRFSLDAKQKIMDLVGDLELPDDILKQFLLARNEKATAEDIDKEYPTVRKDVIWMLIKNKLAAQLDVKVEEEDRKRLARFFAAQQYAQYGMTNVPDDVLDEFAQRLLDDEKHSENINERCFEDKLYAAIKNTVTIDEQKVSVDDFNKLFENK